MSVQRKRGVTYVTRGDESLVADVYIPPGEGPFPGVLMVHGGAWAAGSRWNMLIHANQLARNGYTCVSINYRHAPKHKHPAQYEDCRAALKWMVKHAADYKIDTKRLAGYGYSAGGHLVALLGLRERVGEPKLRAIVAGGAPCDFQWVADDSQSLVYFLGSTRGRDPDLYKAASPLTFASRDDPPVFFFHGGRDALVPIESPRRLHQRLTELGVKSEIYVADSLGHIATFSSGTARKEALEFLDKVLKPTLKPALKPARAKVDRDGD
ncbi:MAG: alpha/beta hydrolase [Pirellulaceae bacterium]|nr:alpha/beta hydrolase [Pirellulaceae bacterium]MDP7018342.1 alpha/beta hydrolase [Pirellulaceae bacterium]